MIVMQLDNQRSLMIILYIKLKIQLYWKHLKVTHVNIWSEGWAVIKCYALVWSVSLNIVQCTFLYCGEGEQGLRLFILYVRQRSDPSFVSTLTSNALYTPSWTCSCLNHMQDAENMSICNIWADYLPILLFYLISIKLKMIVCHSFFFFELVYYFISDKNTKFTFTCMH